MSEYFVWGGAVLLTASGIGFATKSEIHVPRTSPNGFEGPLLWASIIAHAGALLLVGLAR